VWLSPGLPADRAELAAALPSDLVLADHSLTDPALSSDHEAEVHDLPVGSLCVVTVFETDLVARLASRPQGVRLLVVGPEDYVAPGAALGGSAFGERAPELVTTASSVGQLATAIQQLATFTALQPTALPTAALPTAPLDTVSSDKPAAPEAPSAKRGRLITAGAVLAGLAIGGIVIASTEGASSASANGGRGGFGGGNGSAVGGFGGGGTFGNGNGGGAPGGTGTQGNGGTQGGPGGTGTIPNSQELLACLQKQGFTGTAGQLLQSRNDPKLQQAFLTCVQQLRASGNTSSKITGRP
jgi:hypothetical protein